MKNIKYSLKPNGIGLYYGKTGISYLFKGNNIPDLREYKSELNFNDFSFSKGITGVGWVLQTLIEEDKIKLDYSQILGQIDDLIYKDTVNKKYYSLSLFSESSLLAKAMYLYKRIISSKNPISNYYNQIATKECLFLLISEICEVLNILTLNQKTIFKRRTSYYLELGQCFILLYYCMKGNINKVYVQHHLKKLRVLIEDLVNRIEEVNSQNAHYIFYLLYAYSYIAGDMSETSMISQYSSWKDLVINKIEKYLSSFTDYKLLQSFLRVTNFNMAKMETLKNEIIYKNSFYLWDYLYINLDSQVLYKDSHKLMTFLLE